MGDCCYAETGPLTAAARWVPAPRNDVDAGAADLGLQFVGQLLLGGAAFVEGRRSRGVCLENALDDEEVLGLAFGIERCKHIQRRIL